MYYKVKFWEKGDAPPAFLLDGINFVFIKRNSLLIACTTRFTSTIIYSSNGLISTSHRFNISPSNTIEFLNRLAKVFKDYCGVLNEEAIRKNFILLYELLDEMMDFGYPQMTSTELLKGCIQNEAIAVTQSRVPSIRMPTISMTPRTMPSSASNKPIALGPNSIGPTHRNEIFVDIVERLSVLFNANGLMVNSSIDGSIQMKSFLSGNPELRLALNEDLVIGKGGGAEGSVVLDDCNFHECVRLDEFETSRTLRFIPPEGEFAVLNYRVTGDFRAPFRVNTTLEEIEGNLCRLDILCVIRADLPFTNHATNVTIRIPVPRSTIVGSVELHRAVGNAAEYIQSEKVVLWNIKKLSGGGEMSMRVKLTLDQNVSASSKREVGPVSMNFEIPMYTVSNLQVRYLRISETVKSYNPYRWVRYVTQSSSYVCRLRY